MTIPDQRQDYRKWEFTSGGIGTVTAFPAQNEINNLCVPLIPTRSSRGSCEGSHLSSNLAAYPRAMSDGLFETPNTRSRRKREDDAMASGSSGSKPMGSQEDERVVWVHDQRLRRAVLSATEHGECLYSQVARKGSCLTRFAVELAPPTPTQRPRPLSSSRPAGSSSSSSSRPPRKRPCRNSRSENNGSSSKPKQASSSSSLPNKSDGEVKLDLLLQRFELLSTPLGPSRAAMPSNSTHSPHSNVLQDQSLTNHNINLAMSPNTSSPVTRSSTSVSLGKQASDFNGIATRPALNADSPLKACTSARGASSIAPGRHAQKSFPTGQQKPFKPPLLNPPTRSSPRHLRTNTIIPPSPLRASVAAPSFTGTGRPRPPPAQVVVAETPCRGKIRKHNANVDVGEDDPAGDSSFDSFDGLFQDGGPEIEELLKTVDGSQ